VLPVDHYIRDVPRFREVLQSAVADAGRWEEIVTPGITHHRPETGYGYTCRVECFCEKPGYERRLEFLAGGNYLSNSGMFVLRIER